MDDYHKDGIADWSSRAIRCLDWKAKIEASLFCSSGTPFKKPSRSTLEGMPLRSWGAQPDLHDGYLDCIAGDLPAVLDAARENSLQELNRPGVDSMYSAVMWKQSAYGSRNMNQPLTLKPVLFSQERTLKNWSLLMKEYSGVILGKCFNGWKTLSVRVFRTAIFTQRQAQQDLQIALWYPSPATIGIPIVIITKPPSG